MTQMQPRLSIRLLVPLLLVPAVAAAQNGGRDFQHSGFQPPVSGGGVVPPKRLPPPPALPGAASSQAPAPAERLPTDLPPTEALFDAIDRGDMLVAKDALSRGADLNGVNVLGMTPIEMAVDLGRSDITFLLLSLRGATPSARAGTLARSAVPPGTSVAGGAAKPVTRASASVNAERPRPPAAPERSLPRVRYATTAPSGANLQAGFLGFGAGASEIAQP